MGLDQAGSTTSLWRLQLGEATEVGPVPTIGEPDSRWCCSHRGAPCTFLAGFTKTPLTHNGVALEVWDAGGHPKVRPARCRPTACGTVHLSPQLRPLWRHYMMGTDLVLFVVDSNARERLQEGRCAPPCNASETPKHSPLPSHS